MSEPMYCINHPNVETGLRCNKCGQPICVKCVVATPVGYRCSNCINQQQQVFYADSRPSDYLITAAVALPLALVAGWLVISLGWYAIILGPLVGTGIAEAARRAVGRRRGQHTWLVVCGCIVVGALPKVLFLLFSFVAMVLSPADITYFLAGSLMSLLWAVVYLATAAGAAYASLRPGRRA